ncbi:MAG: hypothetical protein DMF53_05250 [Acidobacteria bacterium]|nr:MAG: hypothetical protein DMF53_05250 [Acidobacteriota bacterium]
MRLKFSLNRRASTTLILCLTTLALRAGGAGAQSLVQYTPPGGPQEKPESRREELERQIEAARYHLGPVRVAPWLALRDVAYVRSLFTSGQPLLPNDFTATVGAGFRAYLRNSSKATWTAQVLPEYVWWQKQTQRRQLNGRYLLGFAGYFNHLTLEVQAGRQQQQQIVTPEVPVPVSSRNDGGELLAELRLSRAFSLFAATSFTRTNNLVDDLRDPLTGALRLLDRDDRAERLGVRWRPERRWTIGVAGERTESDFTHQGALDRSNSGTAPLVEMRFRGNHLGLEAEAADRSLTARRGADLIPFHGVTGNAAITVGGAQTRATATLYTNRALAYSLSPLYSYFTDRRLGAALAVGFGQRTRGRVFVEGGRNDYTAFSAATPHRVEDVSSYGGSLTFELRPSLRLGIEGVRSHFSANLPGESRTYTSVGATITLAELP